MAPTVILVRHAEALHNVDNKSTSSLQSNIAIHLTLSCLPAQDYDRPDPDLSEKGRGQCLELRENLVETLPAKGLDVGLILVSPMRRTCQTALLACDFLIKAGVPIQAHAGWQENSFKPCDTGSSIQALKAEFPTIDFSKVDPVYPDKTTDAGAHYKYSRNAILNRAQTNIAELHARTEKAILVVSHSSFMRVGMTGWWFFNADYRVFEIAEKKDDKEDWSLKQWEWTQSNAGGMGRSFADKVLLGTDLPDV